MPKIFIAVYKYVSCKNLLLIAFCESIICRTLQKLAFRKCSSHSSVQRKKAEKVYYREGMQKELYKNVPIQNAKVDK